MSRTKAWCFTSYNESEPAYDRSIHQYLVFGLETCAATARRHYQGYVVLRERKRVTQLRQMFPNAHLAAARGSPQQAAAYCKKGGQYTEYGRLPSAAAGSGAFADVLRAAEDGDIAAIKDAHPGVFLRYKTNILSSRRFDVAELNASCGVWICGPPRCGKDRGVLALGDVFSKGVTKWWDGYAGEKYVLLSDVEPSHGPLLGFYLKIWADRYPFGAEVKGSSIRIRPKKVFVTSNFTMAECFSDRILDALRARFSQFDKFDDSYTPRPAFAADASLHAWLLEKEDGLASTDAPTSE